MKMRGLIAAAAAVACSACSVMEDSKQMKTKLIELDEKGQRIAKRIEDLEIEATFDRSYKSFQEETEKLFAENGKDDVVESDMVMHAQAAISSMLFQFWKGDYADTLAALDDRFSLHADMFYSRVNGQGGMRKEISPTIPSRGYKGVAALGARLHVLRPEYAAALQKNNLPRLSLFDVTVMALRSRHGNGPQPLLPKTFEKVLEWKQEAVFTLQLRQNFLPLMVACRLGDLRVRGEMLANPRNLITAIMGQKVSLNAAEPKKIDDVQLKAWTLWLKAALETRKTLRELGFTPEYNQIFGQIVNALDFGQTGILAQSPTSVTSPRARLEYEFAQAYMAAAKDMVGAAHSAPGVPPGSEVHAP